MLSSLSSTFYPIKHFVKQCADCERKRQFEQTKSLNGTTYEGSKF